MSNSPIHHLKNRLTVAELTMPPYFQGPYRTTFNWGKTLISLGSSLRLSIYGLEKDNLSIGFLGRGTNLNMFSNLLDNKGKDIQKVNQASLFHLYEIVQQMQTQYNVVVVELPYRILQHLPKPNGFFTRGWFRWEINTEGQWSDIEKRFNKDAHNNLKKIQDIACIQSHKQADFEHFYWDIYYPYITQRFGELVELSSFDILEQLFKRGWLMFYRDKGELLGGGIQYIASNVLYNYVMGINGEPNRHKVSQVSTARLYGSLKLALRLGCRAVELGVTRPLLNNGVVRYKRKWGAQVIADPNQNWGLWLSIGSNPSLALPFLAQHPWIWHGSTGCPKGLVIEIAQTPLDATAINKILKRLWVPGLENITLYAPNGFTPDIPLVSGPLPALGPATQWKVNT